jgi:hypothetical protein
LITCKPPAVEVAIHRFVSGILKLVQPSANAFVELSTAEGGNEDSVEEGLDYGGLWSSEVLEWVWSCVWQYAVIR